MKRCFALFLTFLLFLGGCAARGEMFSTPENTQAPATEPAEETDAYMKYIGLKIDKTEEGFKATVSDGGSVTFGADGTLLGSRGIEPVDGSKAIDLAGKTKEELLEVYGEPHCDTGSGVERPTYITRQCTLLAFTVWAEKVGFLTVTDILTKETKFYGINILSEDEELVEADLSFRMEDGCAIEGIQDWVTFVDLCDTGTLAQITIRGTYEGTDYESILIYDGVRYTLVEEDAVRTYKHLVYSSQNLPTQSKYDFAEHYLLSDDPEMTMDRFFKHNISSVYQPDFPATTIVYSDYLSFDRAECFGTVPAKYASTENLSLLRNASFGEEGFYQTQVVSLSPADASDLSKTVRKCYSYDFKALKDNALPEEDFSCAGYYKGEKINKGDNFLRALPADRLPDEKSLREFGVFDEKEGYIIVRCHYMEPWKLQPSYFSHRPRYSELIITAYDGEGTALWQTTGDIFVS